MARKKSKTPDELIAELELFNHHEAAKLLKKLLAERESREAEEVDLDG